MMKKHDMTLRQVRRLVRAVHPKAYIDKLRARLDPGHSTDTYVVRACYTGAASNLSSWHPTDLSSWHPTEARAWREAAQRITDRIVSL